MKGQRVDFRRGAVIEEGFFYRRNLFKGVEGRSKVNSTSKDINYREEGESFVCEYKTGLGKWERKAEFIGETEDKWVFFN